jgi:hypothetical protein
MTTPKLCVQLVSTSPKAKLPKKITRKTVNVKVREPIYKHLEEFRNSHGWSVNETILQAINLLIVIQHFDREDYALCQGSASSLLRQTGRLFYEGRAGERKDFAGDLMISMGKSPDPTSTAT